VAVLAVLRRRFPDRVATLAGGIIALSLLATLLNALTTATGQVLPAQPSGTEVLALALVVGAACHRLAPASAIRVTVLGGLAVVAAPVFRYGFESPAALLAVPAAQLWGGSLAVGLILRDADSRRTAEVTGVRAEERALLARELHDLVAHQITGIVVRVQAARRVTERHGGDTTTYAEIEETSGEALASMRRLVGMLRVDGADLFDTPRDLITAIDRAVPDDVVLRMPGDLDEVTALPEVVTTTHRLLTEAVTNARRHAPRASEVQVDIAVEHSWLVLEVVNDGAAASPAQGGYGLIGMTERVTAVGGTVQAGPVDGRRWRVVARLPLG
jgi:signal transduction histidine kinase